MNTTILCRRRNKDLIEEKNSDIQTSAEEKEKEKEENRDTETDAEAAAAEADIILCPQKLLDQLLMVCPNVEFCQEVMPRSDLQWHLINRCKGVVTNCINVNIGCSFQSTRASLQLHLEECLYKDKGKLCWLGSASPQLCVPQPRRKTVKIYNRQDSLGISIVGGRDTPLVGVIVQDIFKHGAAYKDGRLQEGDQLLEVNGVDLRRVTHQAAVDALTARDVIFQFTIFRETTDQYSSSISQKNNETQRRSHSTRQRGAVTCNAVSEGESGNSRSVSRQRVNRQKPPIVSSPMTTTMDLITWPLEDCQEHVIKVDKVAYDSLGISIAGGRFSCGYDVPIYVTNLQPNGCLAMSGQIAKGDVLVRIGRLSLVHLTHSEATEILKQIEGNGVSITIIRRRPRPPNNRSVPSTAAAAAAAAAAQGNFHPQWKFWLSLPSICYSTKTLTLERSNTGSLGFAIVGGYETSSPTSTSSSDSVVTSFVPIFVRSIVHNGPAANDGRLRSGDMIVAVDGFSLTGVGHAEAVRLLAAAGTPVTLSVVSWPGTLV